MKEAATKLGSNGATLIPTSNPKLDQREFGGRRHGIFGAASSSRSKPSNCSTQLCESPSKLGCLLCLPAGNGHLMEAGTGIHAMRGEFYMLVEKPSRKGKQ